jgi:hypothetical protein
MSVDTKAERVIFVEYQEGRPFSIETTAREDNSYGDTYDVEWCRRDKQLYYHNSGCGPIRPFKVGSGTTYWAAKGIAVDAEEGAIRLDRAKGKEQFERRLAGDYNVSTFDESACTYCSVCDDHLPSEDTYEPCEHVWWCDDAGWWSTPGERCPWDCEDCREHGRETKPPPPTVVLARGYGMAASELGSLARRLLAQYGFTPGSLAERFGCDEWTEGIAMALRGEVHPDATPGRLREVARVLGLDDGEREELFRVFKKS